MNVEILEECVELLTVRSTWSPRPGAFIVVIVALGPRRVVQQPHSSLRNILASLVAFHRVICAVFLHGKTWTLNDAANEGPLNTPPELYSKGKVSRKPPPRQKPLYWSNCCLAPRTPCSIARVSHGYFRDKNLKLEEYSSNNAHDTVSNPNPTTIRPCDFRCAAAHDLPSLSCASHRTQAKLARTGQASEETNRPTDRSRLKAPPPPPVSSTSS